MSLSLLYTNENLAALKYSYLSIYFNRAWVATYYSASEFLTENAVGAIWKDYHMRFAIKAINEEDYYIVPEQTR